MSTLQTSPFPGPTARSIGNVRTAFLPLCLPPTAANQQVHSHHHKPPRRRAFLLQTALHLVAPWWKAVRSSTRASWSGRLRAFSCRPRSAVDRPARGAQPATATPLRRVSSHAAHQTVHLSVVKAPEAMTRTRRICYRKHFGTMTTAAQSAERNSFRSLDTCDGALSRRIYRPCSVSAFAGCACCCCDVRGRTLRNVMIRALN